MPQVRLTLEWGMRDDGADGHAYARLRELGLTTYGEVTAEALMKLGLELLSVFLKTHYEAGNLEQMLFRAGEEEPDA